MSVNGIQVSPLTTKNGILQKAKDMQWRIALLKNRATPEQIKVLVEMKIKIVDAIRPFYSSPELSIGAPAKEMMKIENELTFIETRISAQKKFEEYNIN